MMNWQQTLGVSIGIFAIIGAIFGIASAWRPRARTLKAKPQALTIAEQDFAKGDLKSSVINLFIALERGLKETLGLKTGAFELIDLARERNLIDAVSQDFLHQLRLLRNRLVHEGSQKLSRAKVEELLNSGRRALNSLGFRVRD
jgi:hypothetical protein